MSEATIELLAEGTGPKVRTQKLTTPSPPDSAGAATPDSVAHEQVVAVADARGDLVDQAIQTQILGELGLIRATLQLILAALE